jgi:hypothetical protein
MHKFLQEINLPIDVWKLAVTGGAEVGGAPGVAVNT